MNARRLVVAVCCVFSVGCAGVLGIEGDPTVQPRSCEGTVYVRIASDFSGTTTDVAIPYNWGIYDYLRKLNDTGGIRGCQIDIGISDNSYDPKKTEDVVNAWRANDPNWSKVSTVFVFGTGPTRRVAPSLSAEKKVIIPGSYAGSLASPVTVTKDVTYPVVNEVFQSSFFPERKTSPGWPYIFFPATEYGTAIRLGIQAAWRIAPGTMAMAHDSEANCLYCVDPLAAGKSFIESLPGMKLGRDLNFRQTSNPADEPAILDAVNTYFTQEINQVLANPSYTPVTWVWAGNTVFSSSKLAKGVALAQKMIDADTRIPATTKARWRLKVMANNWGIGETTPSICGSLCNGIVYGIFPVPRYGDVQNATGMVELITLHDEYAAKDVAPQAPLKPRTISDHRDVRYVQGYAAALMWRKGMEAAIDAGNLNPTGDQLKEALETFREVDMADLTAGRISFSATDHRPQSTATIYLLDDNAQFTFVNRYSIQLLPDWLGY